MTERTVFIGPIEYQIEIVYELTGREFELLDGCIDYARAKIHLDDGITPQMRPVILWHEILHAIFEQSGHEHDESLITALSYGITQMLSQNPGIREDLYNGQLHLADQTDAGDHAKEGGVDGASEVYREVDLGADLGAG